MDLARPRARVDPRAVARDAGARRGVDARATHRVATHRVATTTTRTRRRRRRDDDDDDDDDATTMRASSNDAMRERGPTRRARSTRVIGRGRSSVVTRDDDDARATKRVRVDDRAIAAQATREMWVFRQIWTSTRDARRDGREDDDGWSSTTRRALGVDPKTAEDDEDGPRAPTREGLVRCLGFGYDVRSHEVSIALELMHFGSLEDVARTRGSMRFAPRAAMRAATCVANGLAYLHDVLGLVHRDVKPSNVLVNARGECKLGDFGLCAPIAGGDAEDAAYDALGTIMYMSPERLESGAAKCGPEADVWGMGLTIVESLTGTPVFDIEDGGPLGLVVQIMDDDVDVDGAVEGEDAASNALRALLSACLRKDPTKRVTARELIDPSRTSAYHELKLHSYTRADMAEYLYPRRRGEDKVAEDVVETRTTSRESTPCRFNE